MKRLHLWKKQSTDYKWPYGDLTPVSQLRHARLSHDFTSSKALAGFLIRNQVIENFRSDADVFVQENYSKKFDWAQKGKRGQYRLSLNVSTEFKRSGQEEAV